MRVSTTFALLAQVLAVQSIRIIQSNDDGWAELYLRSFNDALRASGHDVLVSAPAENKSRASTSNSSPIAHRAALRRPVLVRKSTDPDLPGSKDVEPEPRVEPCQYDSCPANSGPVGLNETRRDLRWVNSFPVTSMRYGIEQFAPEQWQGQAPELAVAGPNVGSNLIFQVLQSGTVGAAAYAAAEKGIPAIAFSGINKGVLPWNTSPVPAHSTIYGELAARLVDRIVAGGAPYLPPNVFLNVNMPEITDTQCNHTEQFRWVLSRINWPIFSGPDVGTCGSKDRLPVENSVIDTKGCYVSVSVGDATDKTTASREQQQIVLDRLGDFLSCLP
ncbi:Acid phosphatase [Colletotrichum chlorophyti]|uniref:Acid phosphatase n=1 Tax=Colletotrichum chlorophyti TaxID=708187 RepID=A0A1Q8S848_9PEZI|nr:Acid phosphatase [Colletotrichum chlorophyti]